MGKTYRFDGSQDASSTWTDDPRMNNDYRSSSQAWAKSRRKSKKLLSKARRRGEDTRGSKFLFDNY